MSKIIRLTESELHNMIKEAINEINNVNDFIDNLENDYHNEVMKTYTAFVVVNNSDGSVVANFDKNELIDAVDYAKTLAQKNKYGSYVVCGCDDNHTYSDDIDDEDNSIVYSTDENENNDNNNPFHKNLFSLNENYTESYTENYTHFAVNKNTGLIVNGWDYSDYDPEELRQFKRDYFFDDLMDNDFNPKDYKILTRKGCERQGINPDDIDNCWSNAGEIPCSQERMIHKNKYIYNNN